VYDLAQSLERVLLTHNAEDFHELRRKRPGHRGIMAVYRDADPRKNMDHAGNAVAIRALERSGLTIAGNFHVLNYGAEDGTREKRPRRSLHNGEATLFPGLARLRSNQGPRQMLR